MGVAALGAIVGDNAGYWMGRRLGRPFIERYGRYVIARHATRQLKALLGVSVLTEALHLLLKSLIHRQRPHLWAGLWSLTDYSFPSGHSMGAMAIYGLLAYLLSLHYPRQAWLITLGAAGLILAIGASRMLLGVHWPTDVLGGYAAGACVLCAGV